ncbi:MAG: MBL fold metallo-hydrolase, partial [Alphaproteobacteria bacterium]
ALDAAIRTVTKQPVKVVINTGGQDHRWIGNSYWRERGARIIASQAALADHKDRGSLQMTMLDALIKDKLDKTNPVYADETFAETHKFSLGGVAIEIHHKGQAHTPGDAFVWLPQSKVMFTGDIVYVERLAGVGPMSNAGSWIKVFEAMAAYKPKYLVPGHGGVTDLKRAREETYDYLVALRKQMAAHIEKGGDMIGSVKIDQSAFSHLENFGELAKRNAQQVFAEMEFE